MIQTEDMGDVIKIRMARSLPGRSPYFTAAYWVDGLLVDSGCAHTCEELVRALQDLPLHCVVNTHSHEDHTAGNARLQRERGCTVLAHQDALPILANPKSLRLQPYRRIFWGWPEPCIAEPVGPFVETEHHRFQVLHTPGHSPDHICLYEQEEGWLFTGDTYIGGKDRALRVDYNIYKILEALKKLATLDLSRLFPGSGSVREDPEKDLQEKIAYLEETGEKIRALHEKGWSRRQIRRKVLGRELPIAYMTLFHFAGRHLVSSFLEDGP